MLFRGVESLPIPYIVGRVPNSRDRAGADNEKRFRSAVFGDKGFQINDYAHINIYRVRELLPPPHFIMCLQSVRIF